MECSQVPLLLSQVLPRFINVHFPVISSRRFHERIQFVLAMQKTVVLQFLYSKDSLIRLKISMGNFATSLTFKSLQTTQSFFVWLLASYNFVRIFLLVTKQANFCGTGASSMGKFILFGQTLSNIVSNCPSHLVMCFLPPGTK